MIKNLRRKTSFWWRSSGDPMWSPDTEAGKKDAECSKRTQILFWVITRSCTKVLRGWALSRAKRNYYLKSHWLFYIKKVFTSIKHIYYIFISIPFCGLRFFYVSATNPNLFSIILKECTILNSCILFLICYLTNLSSLTATSLRKVSVSTFCLFGRVDKRYKSPVITPSSMVWIVAFSRSSANFCKSSKPSNSPRFLSAPVQAKSVATELVDVV